MRAAQITRFGDWRVLRVAEVSVPAPGPGDVLVRVAASSVNSVDRAHREGKMRVLAGRRLPQGVGIDAVGTVESVGAGVTRFRRGDRVWGIRADAASMRSATGLTAELATISEQHVALAPTTLDDAQAAALVVGGYTALRALRDVAHLRSGERVLVRGGAGGVGSAAVQVAAALGARVAVLASARSEAVARGLGAEEFFDHRSTRPGDVGPVDVMLDTVGTELLAWRRTLTPTGRMVGIAFDSPAALASIAMTTIFGTRRIRTFAGGPPAGSLADVTRFVEDNAIHALVHDTFALQDVQAAHHAFQARPLHGKLVITTAL
jgi:NADPH:quinone reductase-like Zn-dependent oxidoreductase